jgi:hypothetical protein
VDDQDARALIIEELTRYRNVTQRRNVLFREAFAAGLTVREICVYSGAAMTTIYRALGRTDG